MHHGNEQIHKKNERSQRINGNKEQTSKSKHKPQDKNLKHTLLASIPNIPKKVKKKSDRNNIKYKKRSTWNRDAEQIQVGLVAEEDGAAYPGIEVMELLYY